MALKRSLSARLKAGFCPVSLSAVGQDRLTPCTRVLVGSLDSLASQDVGALYIEWFAAECFGPGTHFVFPVRDVKGWASRQDEVEPGLTKFRASRRARPKASAKRDAWPASSATPRG